MSALPHPHHIHTTRAPNSQRDISKAKVNHVTHMPKVLHWLPASARIKWKLIALHSDLSFLLFLHSYLPSVPSFSQPLKHTKFVVFASDPVLSTPPPASPKQPPIRPHLSSNTSFSKRPLLNPTLTYFNFTELIRVQCPLYLIFAYLNIYLPLVESKTLKGRDFVLFIPGSHNLSSAGTLQECHQQLLINWLTKSKNLHRPH